MNILIFNWRDPINPEHGGAEVLTHEIAKRWVGWGHNVTQVSAKFRGAKPREELDGVEIIRRGWGVIRSFRIPVHVAAFAWYQSHAREFDIVIDEIHGIPFFTPLFVRKPVVALICEVAKELWDVSFPKPLNYLGRVIENSYFRFYKNVPFLTISKSTQEELITMGVTRRHITVLPMGLTVPQGKVRAPKEKVPTLIYVGRLTKAKGIEDALDVVREIKKSIPSIRLWVIGQGEEEYVAYLKQKIKERMLEDSITLFGYVDDDEKFQLLSRAHILIAPSKKEGWGLTIPEAGFVGTPSVAYDVSGFRDILQGQNAGIKVTPNVLAMTEGVRRVLQTIGTQRYVRMARAVRRLSKKYSWDHTAKIALRVLENSRKKR